MDKLISFFVILLLAGCSSSSTPAPDENEPPSSLIDKKESPSPESSTKTFSTSQPNQDEIIKGESTEDLVKEVEPGPTESPKKRVFALKTKEYGLEGEQAVRLYAVDFDNDGHTDLVTLPDFYDVPKFFRFNPKKRKFVLVEESPFPFIVRASFFSFTDFNNDGIKDVIVATLNQKTEMSKRPLRLFLGKVVRGKLSYEFVPDAFNKKTYPLASLGVFDYDLDGNLDLYLGNWFDYAKERPKNTPDRILKGDGVRFKRDVSIVLEDEHEFKKDFEIYPNAIPTFGVTVCDVDQNGYPDIMATGSSGHNNKLWMNLRDHKNDHRKFKDYGIESNFASDLEGRLEPRGGGNSFFSLCLDYNNDGIMDSFIGELFHSYDPEERDRSSILTGSRFEFPPKFIRSEYFFDDGTGKWDQGDRRGVAFDYNNDGLQDVIVDNSGFPPKSRLILFHQEINHAYRDVSKEYGLNLLNPSGTVTMDLNNDGRMDMIVGQTSLRSSKLPEKIWVFENVLPREGRRSIRFHLEGDKSNRDGIGAMVILKSQNFLSRKFVSNLYGPLPSQVEDGVHFGLGKDNDPELVEVRWPYEVKDRVGRIVPLIQQYNLEELNFKRHVEVTLCESGRWLVGIKSCK